ncbi:uncharacterized protein LOC102807869 [Saccoglossus kowalevskii]|uniref:Zinc finger protein 91-like n=1 Tax=Saccoglossus kowalevskii TaxID=10224 RepID=A0ABM0MBY6_SACKO|nr:PREDICTED: zinc finger protein 91-like [Saccoglossus kowalevskii]
MAEVALKCEQCDFVGDTYTRLTEHVTTEHAGESSVTVHAVISSENSDGEENKDRYAKPESPVAVEVEEKIDENVHVVKENSDKEEEKSPENTDNQKEEKQTDGDDSSDLKKDISLVCFICQQKFSKKDRLASHISYVHGGVKLYECTICTERFTWRDSYSRHLRKAHQVNTFDCQMCLFTSVDRAGLTEHMNTHIEVEYKCQMCDEVFSTVQSLEDHKKIHEAPQSPLKTIEDIKISTLRTRPKCNACNLTFKVRKYYTLHNRLVHGIYMKGPKHEALLADSSSSDNNGDDLKTTLYSCHLCHKTYTSWKSFGFHKRKVHNIFVLPRQGVRPSPTVPRASQPYKCLECSASFASASNRSRHMKMAHHRIKQKNNKIKVEQADASAGDRFECNICNRSFGRRCDLSHHQTKSHPNEVGKPHRCKTCGKRFVKECHLQCHEKWHLKSKNKPCKCKVCHKGFYKRSDLIRHSQMHKKETHFYCNICPQNFSSLSALVLHKQQSHATEKRSPANLCTVCGEKFTSKVALACHVKSHPNVHICDICSFAATETKKFRSHYEKHIDPVTKAYKCYYRGCHHSCKSKDGLQSHISNHYSGEHFKCKICGLKTNYKPNLARHMETVHQIKDSTPKRIYKLSKKTQQDQSPPNKRPSIKSLIVRLKTEESGRERAPTNDEDSEIEDAVTIPTRKCKVCYKEFKSSSDLRRHEWTHSDDKPYVCVHCGRGFTRHDKLKTHQCKPVKNVGMRCSTCGDCFESRFELSLHQVTHRQDVRVQCSLCDETFRSRVDLNSHQYTVHQNERSAEAQKRAEPTPYKFTCSKCGKMFKLWKNMKIHINKSGPCLGAAPISNTLEAQNNVSPRSLGLFKTPTSTAIKKEIDGSYAGYGDSTPLDLSAHDASTSKGHTDMSGLIISNVCSLNSNDAPSGSGSGGGSRAQSRLQMLLTGHKKPVETVKICDGDEGYSDKSNGDSLRSSSISEASSPSPTPTPRQNRFKCKHCDITFPDAMLFTIHMGIHGSDHAFQCNTCGENCRDRNSFMLHFVGQHS